MPMRLREAADGGESNIIEGYAIRFNEKSVVLCNWYDGMFREIINAAACPKKFLDEQDIKLTIYHNRERILARSNKGKGTLHYEVREDGVFCWAELPDTEDGRTARELIKRGDLAGMSFAYCDGRNAGSVVWSEDEDGVPVREVMEMSGIYDMTIAADPAYPTTSVSARECPTVVAAEAAKAAAEKTQREKENAVRARNARGRQRDFDFI